MAAEAAGPGRLPLKGIRVLDCSQILAGPMCSRLLGDMGADVIKVERPDGGDDLRASTFEGYGGEAPQFLAMNRNKRSVALDIRTPEGRELFRRLAEASDVLIENFRPGTMDRLGLGYEELHRLNPRLVFCSISGFGQTGPYRDRGGFDLVAQGMSGLMSVTGIPDGPPVKVGVPIADLNSGMFGCYGILCALIGRDTTGEGQHVDISLLEAGIAYTVWESAFYWATGAVSKPLGSAHRNRAPYEAFATADGQMTVGVGNEKTWGAFCEAIERRDLFADPRFAKNGARVRNRNELRAELEPVMRTRTTAEWIERMNATGCPGGPIYDMEQVYKDEHVLARQMLVEVDHPRAGRVKDIGIPVKLSATPGGIHRPAPVLGQHTEEVLTLLLGLPAEEVARLRDLGVIALAEEIAPAVAGDDG
ncbi:MAG: CoA transferase [Candidatus Nephthysia bennettiae]|uniref:CoA transferase n=1 Tax=Candidatus Nephthysia bennettiae TaxID=3127016 RepID=A0A934JYQ9_9BACT|nr:CoA transferase [Candidatus Dormibacteraeota bacterium]MBJ7613961.1 CoA transferase [Candidatus Dormibacteraeota bacterium]PZR88453.1 MAG: CoA transferase [Candidatus Dormibacteraeota bacterium]